MVSFTDLHADGSHSEIVVIIFLVMFRVVIEWVLASPSNSRGK